MALKQVMENKSGTDENFQVTIAVMSGEGDLIEVQEFNNKA